MKSFRAKIIIYSLLSLIYTVLTEVAVYTLVKLIASFVLSVSSKPKPAEVFMEKTALSGSMALQPGLTKGAFFVFLVAVAVFVGIVLFILYFLLLSRKMVKYLNQIVEGIRKMSNGNLTTRIEIAEEDEFSMIGNQLNKMADNIIGLMDKERNNEKVKNDLITNVAHDLRTPLTSIIGYLDLVIKNEELEEETKKKYIRIAYDKALRLQSLIGDLFSFTKVSTGEMVLKKTRIDIVKLVEQMVEEFYPSFQENGLEYEFSSDCDSAVIEADGDLMARAFSNLISNAVKYGKDGKVIRIWIHRTQSTVSVSVLNYGEVIPEESLEYIFDRFYRVENSRSVETGGSGLGLAIAKKIAVMHGGSIRAESGVGGTVFEIRLRI
ncbi:MAG: sensor histidine kinase [Acetivibrio ethanolgignens]